MTYVNDEVRAVSLPISACTTPLQCAGRGQGGSCVLHVNADRIAILLYDTKAFFLLSKLNRKTSCRVYHAPIKTLHLFTRSRRLMLGTAAIGKQCADRRRLKTVLYLFGLRCDHSAAGRKLRANPPNGSDVDEFQAPGPSWRNSKSS